MKKIDISYASKSEHNIAQRILIKTIEQFTGKRKLQKIYNDFSKNNFNPRYFWSGILESMEINIIDKSQNGIDIPAYGSLLMIANHPFGIIDGLILCSLISKKRNEADWNFQEKFSSILSSPISKMVGGDSKWLLIIFLIGWVKRLLQSHLQNFKKKKLLNNKLKKVRLKG